MATPPDDRIHETWLHSERPVPSLFIRPVLQFTQVEAAGGIILLVAAVIAIIWANSAWHESYFSLFETRVDFELFGIHLDESFKDLINDGLMVIFFFVVGLEIKRELVVGELNSRKKASMPAMAALGGMVVPALIYVAFVSSGNPSAIHGWGIPMATDIAFSVGVVALLGSRVPVGAKLFLLALAIVDDIGAIAVIAIFYTEELSLSWFAIAAVGLLLMWLANRVGVQAILVYAVIGVVVWYAFLESGVHATIAGVIIGLMTPVRSPYSDEEFRQKTKRVLDRWDANRASPYASDRLDQDALELSAVAKASVSPLNRLEIALHPWSSFVIVPLFALANAGVRFVGAEEPFGSIVTSPVTLGVAVGLALGKPIGVTFATWIGLKLNLGQLPQGTTLRTILGLGALAGVGFTVSLFISELAFTESIFAEEAKLGIFIGSFVAGVAGFLLLRSMKSARDEVALVTEELPVS